MNQLDILKKQLKEVLEKNPQEVLQRLKKIFDNTADYNTVVSLNFQFNQLNRGGISGALSREDESKGYNVIIHSILKLIDQIDEHLASSYELDYGIYKKLIVISSSLERESFLRKLFPKDRYKAKVDFDHSLAPLPIEKVDEYDIVLFDNFHSNSFPVDSELYINLLKYYLEKPRPYVLYFGPFEQTLLKYPEKVYFSNSIFSIHTRIEEMRTFIKYYEEAP